MQKLFINIKELIQVEDQSKKWVAGSAMKKLPTIKNAYLLIEDDIIKDFGSMDNCPEFSGQEHIDVSGKMILPTWCDSHTHLVFAQDRSQEFVDRINGLSYQEIASRGGGILNSAKMVQEASEDALYEVAAKRLEMVMKMGTGAIEIKSGYGLTKASEIKMLRVAKRLKNTYKLPIKTTFLGAHALPKEYKDDKSGYMDLVINEMLPEIIAEGLADYIDIFCEKGYFELDDMERLLEAGKKHQIQAKVHVNQFNAFGGVALATKYDALSVDHLEELNDSDIEALKGTNTIPVALPSCSFFLSIPYTPARKLIDAGLPLALATDYNPGSTPSGNMNFVVSTACIKMKMTPEEAINAATLNGAYAMGIQETHGSICKGKIANFMITKPLNSYNYIPYAFGENCIEKVYINGTCI